MFERFVHAYRPELSTSATNAWLPSRCREVAGFSGLSERFAGSSFDGGLYRLVDAASGSLLQDASGAAFPEFQERFVVFGYDWLGRAFGLDFARIQDGEPQVLQLDAGSGQAVEIPTSFVEFHDAELVEYRDDALAATYFAEWLTAAGTSRGPRPSECVGYEAPLFLGGVDDIENLAIQDLEVYWDFCGQLRRQVFGLAEGTRIRRVEPE